MGWDSLTQGAGCERETNWSRLRMAMGMSENGEYWQNNKSGKSKSLFWEGSSSLTWSIISPSTKHHCYLTTESSMRRFPLSPRLLRSFFQTQRNITVPQPHRLATSRLQYAAMSTSESQPPSAATTAATTPNMEGLNNTNAISTDTVQTKFHRYIDVRSSTPSPPRFDFKTTPLSSSRSRSGSISQIRYTRVSTMARSGTTMIAMQWCSGRERWVVKS